MTFTPWIQAARPHTLWAAVVPVLVGSGLAAGDGAFRWDALAAALVASVAIQVAANFANDVFDARKGADTDDRIGPDPGGGVGDPLGPGGVGRAPGWPWLLAPSPPCG